MHEVGTSRPEPDRDPLRPMLLGIPGAFCISIITTYVLRGMSMPNMLIKPFSTPLLLTVSAPPYWHCGRTVPRMMGETILALIPAVIMALVHFGFDAARVVSLSCVTAVLTEALCLRIMGRDICIDDYSALLTGLLFALLLPASAPWWLVVLGSTLSIVIGKAVFGGLGANPVCIPLVGWAICRVSWGHVMDIDFSMLSSEFLYPLSQLKYYGLEAARHFSWVDLLMGRQLGGLGAVQIIPLLAGGIFIVVRGHIRPHIPAAFLAGVLATAWFFQLSDPGMYAPPLFHVLTGSVVLGAFFLAPDHASSPSGNLSMVLFGLICGAMVMFIRVYGIYPDGVPFAILFGNMTAPLLDLIHPKRRERR